MQAETFAAVCAVRSLDVLGDNAATGWCTGSTGSGDPDD
jgi:hypothetical protein